MPIFRILVDQYGFFNDQLLYIYQTRKGNYIITHGSSVRMVSVREPVDIDIVLHFLYVLHLLIMQRKKFIHCKLMYFFETLRIRKPQMPCKYIYEFIAVI